MISILDQGTKDNPFQWFGASGDNFFTAEKPFTISNQKVHYAVQIDISDHKNVGEVPQIGLFNDPLLNGGSGGNAFRWITDRPDYDGSTVVPTGELPTTNATKWGEGMITDRKDIDPPVRLINLNIAGNYGSLSGFQFSIDNVIIESGVFSGKSMAQIFRDESIFLTNRKIRFYVVINNVFYEVWAGVCTMPKDSETKILITCEDDFKNIHKPIPPQEANESLFPNIQNKSSGKTIPVTLGKVNNAKTINIKSQKDPIDLINTGDFLEESKINAKVAAIIVAANTTDSNGNATGSIFSIVCGIKEFTFGELVGKYFRIVNENGQENFFRISASSNSVFNPGFDQNVISFNTDSVIDVSNVVLYTNPADFDDTELCSWVEVFDFRSDYLVSNDEVNDFPDSPDGYSSLLTYFDSKTKEFIDVSEAIELDSLTNISKSGFPGFTGFTDSLANNGIFRKVVVLKPKNMVADEIFVTSDPETTFVSTTMPANGEPVPRLEDGLRNTSYQLIVNRGEGAGIFTGGGLTVRVTLPEEIIQGDFQELFLLADYDIISGFGSNGAWHTINFQQTPQGAHRNFGGFKLETLFSDEVFPAGNAVQIRLIPPQAFGEGGEPPPKYGSSASELDLTSFYSSRQVLRAYPFITFRIFFTNNVVVPAGSDEDLLLKLYQVAIAGSKKLQITDDSIFQKVNGEKLAGGGPTSNVLNGFRKILETYDGLSVSDDFDLTDISSRSEWDLGRQLTEKKSSFDYLKELSMQSFVATFPSRRGKRTLKAFREFTSPKGAFTDQNGRIIKDSIRRFEKSNINETFNEFDLKYEWIEADQRFDKSIFIKNADQDEFPSKFASTIPGNDVSDETFTSIDVSVLDDGTAKFTINWGAVPSGFEIGKFLSYDDNGSNQLHFVDIILVTSLTVVASFPNNGLFSDGQVLNTGTVYLQGSSIPLWTTFAGGFVSYEKGKELWDICHASYKTNLVTRKLPDSYSMCKWYSDTEKFDGVSVNDDSSVHKYLDNLVNWCTKQKDIVEFSTPLNPASLLLEEADFVQFQDVKYTSGEVRGGYITKIKIVPSKDLIVLELTLSPTGSVSPPPPLNFQSEVVDHFVGNIPVNTNDVSISFDSNGTPHIAYRDYGQNALRLAKLDNTTKIDLHDYVLSSNSSPWRNVVGNASITNPDINLTFGDAVVRRSLPYEDWTISGQISLVSGFDVQFGFFFSNSNASDFFPSIRWDSGVATVRGMDPSGSSGSFGALNGQSIPTTANYTWIVERTNNRHKLIINGIDSGFVTFTTTPDTQIPVILANSVYGNGGDTQAAKLGAFTITGDSLWKTEYVSSGGFNAKLKFDSNDRPRIVYWDGFSAARLATFDGSDWLNDTFASETAGEPFGFDIDSSDENWISYKSTLNNMAVANGVHGSWTLTDVYSVGVQGKNSDLIIDSLDRKHLSWQNDDDNSLAYGINNGSWNVTTSVPGATKPQGLTSIGLNGNNPFIGYFSGTVFLIEKDGVSWGSEQVINSTIYNPKTISVEFNNSKHYATITTSTDQVLVFRKIDSWEDPVSLVASGPGASMAADPSGSIRVGSYDPLTVYSATD